MPSLDFQQLLDQAIEGPKAPLISTSIRLLFLHEGEEFFVALILHLLQ